MTSEENKGIEEDSEIEMLREISGRVKSIDDKVEGISDLLEKHFEEMPGEYDTGYDFNEFKDFYHENNSY